MKKNVVTGVSMICLALMQGPSIQAQTWQTVDVFNYAPGKNALALAIAVDASQNVFVAGSGIDASGLQHALVMRSADAGTTWSTIEDYTYALGVASLFHTVGLDAAQSLYALASARISNEIHWIARESGDGGSTWATTDDFHYPASSTTMPQAFAADDAGNVYAAGWALMTNLNSSTRRHWLVRTSGNAGQSWATTDDFEYDPNGASAEAATITPAGVFVAGFSLSGHWLVRKSANAGATWTTVDDFQYSKSVTNFATYALCADAAGNLYVGGWVPPAERWLIRKGTNGGTTWKTVAVFKDAETLNALGVDSKGNLYAVGENSGRSTSPWVVYRSPNQGVSWYASDNFAANGEATCFGADGVGNVYVGGFGGPVPGCSWLVRRATP